LDACRAAQRWPVMAVAAAARDSARLRIVMGVWVPWYLTGLDGSLWNRVLGCNVESCC